MIGAGPRHVVLLCGISSLRLRRDRTSGVWILVKKLIVLLFVVLVAGAGRMDWWQNENARRVLDENVLVARKEGAMRGVAG